MEEHINSDEAHFVYDCPGDECEVYRGLRRILEDLDSGKLVIRRVQ